MTSTPDPAGSTGSTDASPPGEDGLVSAAGIPFATLAWGDPSLPPLLLIHGVTASARIWWRVGPAIAATLGRRVVAVDQAGHGRTGHWAGHHRFADNAADLVAFVRAAGLDRPDLQVVGHSWGGMTAAELPAAGLLPARLVLLDPPALPVAAIASRLDDPVERAYATRGEATAAIRGAYPAWSEGDIAAKAEALTQFDSAAVRDVLTRNGDWDGGLAALAHPAAAHVPTWLIRGDPAAGGLIPDEAVPSFERRLGADRVLTIAGGAHAPMRLKPEETVAALIEALT